MCQLWLLAICWLALHRGTCHSSQKKTGWLHKCGKNLLRNVTVMLAQTKQLLDVVRSDLFSVFTHIYLGSHLYCACLQRQLQPQDIFRHHKRSVMCGFKVERMKSTHLMYGGALSCYSLSSLKSSKIQIKKVCILHILLWLQRNQPNKHVHITQGVTYWMTHCLV